MLFTLWPRKLSFSRRKTKITFFLSDEHKISVPYSLGESEKWLRSTAHARRLCPLSPKATFGRAFVQRVIVFSCDVVQCLEVFYVCAINEKFSEGFDRRTRKKSEIWVINHEFTTEVCFIMVKIVSRTGKVRKVKSIRSFLNINGTFMYARIWKTIN